MWFQLSDVPMNAARRRTRGTGPLPPPPQPSLPTPADLDADPASHGLCCCPRRPRRLPAADEPRPASGIRRLQSRTRTEGTQIGLSLPVLDSESNVGKL